MTAAAGSLNDRLADLLASRLAKYGPGHVARLEGLPNDEARDLWQALNSKLGSDWNAMVVCRGPDDITDPLSDVPIDLAIERRNDKTLKRFFIIPRELEAEAASSLVDTEPHSLIDLIKVVTESMLRTLPLATRDLVREAFRRAPLGQRFEYLQSLGDDPDVATIGLNFWRLGLIPDLAPTLPRIKLNRECVEKLVQRGAGSMSAAQRVELLELEETAVKSELVRLLRAHEFEQSQTWLKELGTRENSTFDKWHLRTERGALRAIHPLGMMDSQKQRPYAWSGLEFIEGTLRVKAPAPGKQPRVTVRWLTDPVELDEQLSYELSIETADAEPILMLSEIHKHRAGKYQSWSFNPRDIADLSETGYLVRVRITAIGSEIEELSDEFLIRTVPEAEMSSGQIAAPTCRSVADLFLESLRSGWEPRITRSQLSPSSEAPSFGIVELDEKHRRRIVLSPVLSTFQRAILQEPRLSRECRIAVSPQKQWTTTDLIWSDGLIGRDGFASEEWWRRRKRIFDDISRFSNDGGLVETVALSPLTDEISAYCRQYLNALDAAVIDGHRALVEQALALDSIHLVDSSDGRLIGIILSPLHPLRLLWHTGHEELVRFWIDKKREDKTHVVVPTARAAEELTASNVPVFLINGGNLLCHSDSPLFHWPLYTLVDSTPANDVSNSVRWALGHNKVEVQAPGREVAARRLSSRIQTFRRHHPYVQALRINAVNVGDGRLVLDAIAALPSGEIAFEDVLGPATTTYDRYDLRLYGSEPTQVIGSYLDECAALYRSGQRINSAVDQLLEVAGDGDYLRPRLSWATRNLDSLNPDYSDDAHISLLVDYFSSKAASIDEHNLQSIGSAATYGLQWDLVSSYNEDSATWLWTIRMPDLAKLEHHPTDKSITSLVVRAQRVFMSSVSLCGLLPEGHIPASGIGFSTDEAERLAAFHDNSDWVITVDRNLSVEAFDWPSATNERVRSLSRRYLIDYVPESIGPAGQQMMISTAWTDEVAGLVSSALRDMEIVSTDLACEAVLDGIKSISGELAMRLTQTHNLAWEAVSLSIVRDYLRGRGELATAFLIPVDEQIEMLSDRGAQREDESGRRVDLLLVRPSTSRAPTRIELIEVKYRRQISTATDPALWRDMFDAVRENKRTLQRFYAPTRPDLSLGLPLYRRRFATLLHFYANRAFRYSLLEQGAREATLRFCESLHRPELDVEFAHRGFVYCPEQEAKDEQYLLDSDGDEFPITVLGRGALRTYTSLEPVRASDDSLIEPPVLGETAPAEPLTTEAAEPAEPAEAVEDEPSAQAQGAAESEPALAIDGPSVDTPSNVPFRAIRLGKELNRGTEVLFEPSVRGNPHLLVVGIPGMGKTTAVSGICQQLSANSVYPFVIDFHGDLAASAAAFSHGTTESLILDAAQGLAFNPLDPGADMRQQRNGWIEHYYEVAEILGDLYPSFGELQIGELRNILRECFEANGFEQDPVGAETPSIYDFWTRLKARAANDRELRKIVSRLQSIFDLWLFQEGGTQSDLASLLRRPTILDLHGIRNQDNQRIAASFFLQRVYRLMFSRRGADKLTNAIVLDEAHRLASLKLIPRIMQECRKYGFMFVLSSQRVDDFQQGVLDSAGSQLCLRVNHPDAKRLAKYLGSSDTESRDIQSRLMQLPKYEALFHTEGRKNVQRVLLDTSL
jgi:hypothetical protein